MHTNPISNVNSALRRLLLALCAVLIVAILGNFALHRLLQPPKSPDALLEEADQQAWRNLWEIAEPQYHRAEQSFVQRRELSKALYARVSQMPAHIGQNNLASQVWTLTQDLALPEAQDPTTKLRVLMIRGMFETNYDAAAARSTWESVKRLAESRHEYLLASRALGEQGIAAYILGDITTAKVQVLSALNVAKYAKDWAAQVRYASVYGAGLVDLQRYQESLGPLDAALNLYKQHPVVAYPTIAMAYKVQALSRLGDIKQALSLLSDVLQIPAVRRSAGQLYQLLSLRADIHEQQGEWNLTIADYNAAMNYARSLGYWRGLSEAGGPLARAYEHEDKLQLGLSIIDEAIEANKQIPDELHFVPQNLAIKAEILSKLGQRKVADNLYQKSADLIDALLTKVPTPGVERLVLRELSAVYSGYFLSLCDQNRFGDAFRVMEMERGRLEAQALQHHGVVPAHQLTQTEQHLINLNLQLLDTDDQVQREQINHAIYETELSLDSSSLAGQTALHPTSLAQLQDALQPSELLIEYVLDDPNSSALVVTHRSVSRYTLKGKHALESMMNRYLAVVKNKNTDPSLAQTLFNELLGPITEYRTKQTLIVIPDGMLNLLPMSALMDHNQYLIVTHNLSVVPSGTVLSLLRKRRSEMVLSLPYVGVAPWTDEGVMEARNFITRAVFGPQRSKLVPLPASRDEVETIAQELPKPSKVLMAQEATESNFKMLPLSQYKVLHLAMHGYADLDYPDRSALIFAPQAQSTDDGLLQVREIRKLRLTASLVTLSACKTGLGSVGADGVFNLVNAFIEAGAQSVVSTLWETEDHATQHLMISFYKNLAEQQPKAVALRQAKLNLLQAGLPPYYWASFELVGEPSATLNTSPLRAALPRKDLP